MSESKNKTIVDTLKREILSGRYSITRAFPSERALAVRFKASRPTVRIAIQELRAQGLVARRQGAGTTVTEVGARRKVGLIIPDVSQSEYFVRIVRELIRVAERERYTLAFAEISGETAAERAAEAERLVEYLIEQNVSGVIFQPIEYFEDGETFNRRMLERLRKSDIPVVLCDNPCSPDVVGYDVVGNDNIAVGMQMYRHLIACGARRPCFFMRPFASQTHHARLQGVMLASLSGRNGTIRKDLFLIAEPDDARLIERRIKVDRIDAFLCGDDETAAKLMQTLHRLGYSVPQDVMVSGVNDLAIAPLLTPSLTTLRINCEQIADAAFERLIARIAKPGLPPTEIFLPAELVVRESTSRNSVRRPAKKGVLR